MEINETGGFSYEWSVPSELQTSSDAIIIVSYQNVTLKYRMAEARDCVKIFADPKVIISPPSVTVHVNESVSFVCWIEYLDESGKVKNTTLPFEVIIKYLGNSTKGRLQNGVLEFKVRKDNAMEFNVTVEVPDLGISGFAKVITQSNTIIYLEVDKNAVSAGGRVNLLVLVYNETNCDVYDGTILINVTYLNISNPAQVLKSEEFTGKFGWNTIEVPDDLPYTANMTIMVTFSPNVSYLLPSTNATWLKAYVEPCIYILEPGYLSGPVSTSSMKATSYKQAGGSEYIIEVFRTENETLKIVLYDRKSSEYISGVVVGFFWNGTWYNRTTSKDGVAIFTIPPEGWTQIGIFNLTICVFDLEMKVSIPVKVMMRLSASWAASPFFVTYGDMIIVNGSITTDMGESVENISLVLTIVSGSGGAPLYNGTVTLSNGAFNISLGEVPNSTPASDKLILMLRYVPEINENVTIIINGSKTFLSPSNSSLMVLEDSKTIYFFQNLTIVLRVVPHLCKREILVLASLIDNYGRTLPNTTVDVYVNNSKIRSVTSDEHGLVNQTVELPSDNIPANGSVTLLIKLRYKGFESDASMIKVVAAPSAGEIDTSKLDLTIFVENERRILLWGIIIGVGSTVIVISEPYLARTFQRRARKKKVKDITDKIYRLMEYLDIEKGELSEEIREVLERVMMGDEEAIREIELPEIFRKIVECLDRKAYKEAIHVCISEFVEKLSERFNLVREPVETIREFGSRALSALTLGGVERDAFNTLIDIYSWYVYGNGPYTKEKVLEAGRALAQVYHVIYGEELPAVVARIFGLGRIRIVEEELFYE